MIVLAKKIVMDKVEAIPEYYDKELNDIVMYVWIYQGECFRKNLRRESLGIKSWDRVILGKLLRIFFRIREELGN